MDAFTEQMQCLSGQRYKGDTKDHLFHGEGEYTFSNGIVYTGGFFEGMFHGAAVVRFPNGCRFTSLWHLNALQSAACIFGDGLQYPTTSPSSPVSPLAWAYCTDADRRFASELQHGGIVLAPLGQSRLCDGRLGSRPLPLGCYDVGDGYLDVESAAVWDWQCRGVRLRDAEKVEIEWAKRKCRIGRDERVRHGDRM